MSIDPYALPPRFKGIHNGDNYVSDSSNCRRCFEVAGVLRPCPLGTGGRGVDRRPRPPVRLQGYLPVEKVRAGAECRCGHDDHGPDWAYACEECECDHWSPPESKPRAGKSGGWLPLSLREALKGCPEGTVEVVTDWYWRSEGLLESYQRKVYGDAAVDGSESNSRTGQISEWESPLARAFGIPVEVAVWPHLRKIQGRWYLMFSEWGRSRWGRKWRNDWSERVVGVSAEMPGFCWEEVAG